MFYSKIVRPALFKLSHKDPETAHRYAMQLLAFASYHPLFCKIAEGMYGTSPNKSLERNVMGLTFPHPIGLAAGFDKNAEAMHCLARIFGFVEVGTVTAERQEGNPRPRMFRLAEDEALINRMGFNNDGAQAVESRLAKTTKRPLGVPLGVSIGKSKVTPMSIDAVIQDHLTSFQQIAAYADYVVINCASPNTPELRTLLERKPLGDLVHAVQTAKFDIGRERMPLVVKFSPDMDWKQIDAALEVCEAQGVAGIIASNTTLDHTKAKSLLKDEVGGLSGSPLFGRAFQIVYHTRKMLPNMAIIASGGINSPARAWQMLEHGGADLVQIYTALVYKGPSFVKKLNRSIANLLSFANLASLEELRTRRGAH